MKQNKRKKDTEKKPEASELQYQPFEIKDCALIIMMSGLRSVVNLRELRDRIEVCSDESIYHHFCQTRLRATFDDPEYRNDFAVWAKRNLHDGLLAERLGIVNPYDFKDIEHLRAGVLDILDERLSELHHVPWVKHGADFSFKQALTVVFDTGRYINRPEDMPAAIEGMTSSSIYYHFLESRRRSEDQTDDFSAWLEWCGPEGKPFISAFKTIDFYFLTLREIQKQLYMLASEIVNRA